MSNDGRLLFDEQAQAKRRWTLFAAGACGIAAICMFFGIGQPLQLTIQDAWYTVRGGREPSPQIVILAIDGRALNAQEERWPWPRNTYAPLIDKLIEAGVKVIGFDMAFSKETPEDAAFAKAMRESGNVVFGMIFNDAGDRSPPGESAPPQIVAHAVAPFDVPFLNVIPSPSVEPPAPVLAEAAAGFGHVVMLPSSDGTIRRVATLIRHGDRFYPSFALQVARVYADVPIDEVEVSESYVRVGYADVPITQTTEALINWTTQDLDVAFPTYSVQDVLRGDIGERELRGKAVLIGMTAEGLDDKEFPFGMTLPGVIVHATFLDNFFTVNFLEAPGWGIALEFGLFLVLAVVAIVFFPRLPTTAVMAAAPVLIAGVLGLSLYLFVTNAIWWPPLYPCIAVAFPFATTIFFKLRSTEKARDVEVAKVREAEDKVAEAQLEKGLAFQEKGSLDLAMATFSRLPESEDMKTVYLNLGFDFQNRGKLDKAFHCYKRVYDMDPSFGDAASRIEALRVAGVGTHLMVAPTTLPQAATAVVQQRQPDLGPTMVTNVEDPDEAPTQIDGRGGGSYVPTQPGTGVSGVSHTAHGLEPQPGTPGSRYQMIKKLGKGAMGEVLLMMDTKLDRKVAIKMMRPDIEMSSEQAIEMRHRFVREAKTAGKLTHPNIVTIYDSFESEDGVAYIAMEFVEGDTLKNLTRAAQFTVAQIKHVFINTAKGLQHAHENGVFHRDVKPDNIMISPKTGVVKVMDFGIARVVESNMTATGSLLGTPAYMAPEQVTGQKVDARSDVFSLGVVLFELVTGTRPFPGSTPTELMFAIVQKQPLIASTAGADRKVSLEWDPITLKALAKKPEERYQTALEFAEAVRQVRAS